MAGDAHVALCMGPLQTAWHEDLLVGTWVLVTPTSVLHVGVLSEGRESKEGARGREPKGRDHPRQTAPGKFSPSENKQRRTTTRPGPKRS